MTIGLSKNTVWALDRDLKPRISECETEMLLITVCFNIFFNLLFAIKLEIQPL
jgi:hypothetical protein